MFTQNARSRSRWIGGLPGDRIAGLPVRVTIHPAGRPIEHLLLEVLRRSVETAQYTSIRYSERLTQAGALASIGTVGDSYDNAQAETLIGLYKLECVRHEGPWRGADDLELATLSWVHWFNHYRLHSALGYRPPTEYEEIHYRQINSRQQPLSR